MIDQALACGFTALGFSDHSYTPAQEECAVPPGTEISRAAELRELKREYSDRIAIYDGIELDWHSERPTLDFDYVIGSVHEMTVGETIVQIDDGAESQRRMIDEHFEGDPVKMAIEYFGNVTDHIRVNRPDFVGHFDLATKYSFVDEEDPRYVAAAIESAREIVKICPTFEANTGAIARKLRTVPYPARFIVEEIKKCGGRFIITSDCHYKERLTIGFDIAEELLASCGFRLNPNGELNAKVRGIEIWE